MSERSAYNLRARPDAESFRDAWDAAIDFSVRRLGDAVVSRAIHGVATPIFYKGEQIGERRSYNDRLAMFLLQRRDPLFHGAWRDTLNWRGDSHNAANMLARATDAISRQPDEQGDSEGDVS
jgi:hypothetical protein